jgi:hypothetical protein
MRKFIVLMLVFLAGCSSAQYRKEFMGISPGDVTGAPSKYTKVIEMSLAECFDKTRAILNEMRATIIKHDKNNYFIAADQFGTFFHSCVNTTEVGILFKEVEANKTRAEVASDNPNLAGAVASKLFTELGKR